MKTSIVIASLFLGACATTGSTGKGSSAAFPGFDAVKKHRDDIRKASDDATKPCFQTKDPGKGGLFAVTADASGKLTAQKISYDGPDTVAQCLVDAINKATVVALPGTPVGMIVDYWAPGAAPAAEEMPAKAEGELNAQHERMQPEVDLCGQRFLGEGFPADISISVMLAPDGTVYVPTVVNSTAKDGSFDGCVLDVIAKQKFPALSTKGPVPATIPFHYGRLEKL